MNLNEWIKITSEVKPPVDQEVLLWDSNKKRKVLGTLELIPVLNEINYFIPVDFANMDATKEEMRDYYLSLNITWFAPCPSDPE